MHQTNYRSWESSVHVLKKLMNRSILIAVPHALLGSKRRGIFGHESSLILHITTKTENI